MIKPHDTFKSVTADEVAETWNGVGNTPLYAALWNKIVPHMKAIPNKEDTGPHDHIGFQNLASHWHRLTEDEQLQLNAFAEAQEFEFEQWLLDRQADD